MWVGVYGSIGFSALPEERERCLVAGMDDFLTKPLGFKTLAETLAPWLPAVCSPLVDVPGAPLTRVG